MTRLAYAILIASFVFQAATIDDGHNWGDDFAQYITHAQNIVRGRPYAESGHLFGKGAYLGPLTYPPGFPLLLAPVHAVFGLNLIALKVVVVFALTIALLLWCRMFAPVLGSAYAAVWAALIGFHPFLFLFKEQVLSETTFMMWVAATLVAMERWWNVPVPRRTALTRGAIIGIIAAAAIGTRSLGVVLLPALALAAIARRRAANWIVVATALVTSVVLTLILWAVIPGQVGYPSEGQPQWQELLASRGQLYAADLIGLLPAMPFHMGHELLSFVRSVFGLAPPPPRIRKTWIGMSLVTLAAFGLMAIGFLSRARRAFGPLEAFVLGYTAMLLLYPFYQGQRYVLPLVPILLFYLVLGVKELRRDRHPAVSLALVAVFGVVFGYEVRGIVRTPFYAGIETADARRMLSFIREQTPRDAVVVSAKPRALYLLTSRAGFAPIYEQDDDALRRLDLSGVTYVVGGLPEDGFLIPLAERHPDRFERLLSSGPFVVYRVAR